MREGRSGRYRQFPSEGGARDFTKRSASAGVSSRKYCRASRSENATGAAREGSRRTLGAATRATALMEAIAAIVIVLCVQLWSAKGDGGPPPISTGLFFSHCQKTMNPDWLELDSEHISAKI